MWSLMFCGLSLSKAITSNGGLLRRAHERSMRPSALSKRGRVKERREPSRTNSTLVKMMIRDCRHHRERAVANSFFAMTMIEDTTTTTVSLCSVEQRHIRVPHCARSNGRQRQRLRSRLATTAVERRTSRATRSSRASHERRRALRYRLVGCGHNSCFDADRDDGEMLVCNRSDWPRRGVGRSSSTSHCAPSKWRCVQRTTREMGVGSHVVEI
jgi:hypothetical protein